MSTDDLSRSERAFGAAPQLSRSRSNDDAPDLETHHLDCQDCVHFVKATGPRDHAIGCARRHLNARSACEAVAVEDAETERRVAIVREDAVESLDERQEAGGGR